MYQEQRKFIWDSSDREMVLSEIGREAEKYWLEIPDNFRFSNLNEFIVMPNHVHGVVTIDKLGVTVDGGENQKGGGINGH